MINGGCDNLSHKRPHSGKFLRHFFRHDSIYDERGRTGRIGGHITGRRSLLSRGCIGDLTVGVAARRSGSPTSTGSCDRPCRCAGHRVGRGLVSTAARPYSRRTDLLATGRPPQLAPVASFPGVRLFRSRRGQFTSMAIVFRRKWGRVCREPAVGSARSMKGPTSGPDPRRSR